MFLRRALVVSLVALGVAAGCARGTGGDRPVSTELTAAELEADTGPCMCRLPQDEGMTCCRSGLLLACTCDGRYSCHVAPTGRACGSASRRPAGR